MVEGHLVEQPLIRMTLAGWTLGRTAINPHDIGRMDTWSNGHTPNEHLAEKLTVKS